MIYGATPRRALQRQLLQGAKMLLIEELPRVGDMFTSGGMGLSDCFFMERWLLDNLFEEIHARQPSSFMAEEQTAFQPKSA